MKNVLTSLLAFAIGASIYAWAHNNLSSNQTDLLKFIFETIGMIGFLTVFALLLKSNNKMRRVLQKNGIPEDQWK